MITIRLPDGDRARARRLLPGGSRGRPGASWCVRGHPGLPGSRPTRGSWRPEATAASSKAPHPPRPEVRAHRGIVDSEHEDPVGPSPTASVVTFLDADAFGAATSTSGRLPTPALSGGGR